VLAKPIPLPRKEDHSRVEDERFAFCQELLSTPDYAERIPNAGLGLALIGVLIPTFNQLDSAYSQIRHSRHTSRRRLDN
jgi:hypothetical protein